MMWKDVPDAMRLGHDAFWGPAAELLNQRCAAAVKDHVHPDGYRYRHCGNVAQRGFTVCWQHRDKEAVHKR